jgi:CRP-like cAMP-binding protein
MSDDRLTSTSVSGASLRLKLVRGVFELKGIPLFEGLSAEDLLPIAEAASRVEARAGDTLAGEGDDATEVWLLLEGRVVASRRGSVVADYGPGDLLGDLALVDGRHPCALRATEPTAMLALRRDDFEELLDLNPALARNVMTRLSSRLRALA